MNLAILGSSTARLQTEKSRWGVRSLATARLSIERTTCSFQNIAPRQPSVKRKIGNAACECGKHILDPARNILVGLAGVELPRNTSH